MFSLGITFDTSGIFFLKLPFLMNYVLWQIDVIDSSTQFLTMHRLALMRSMQREFILSVFVLSKLFVWL
jgi:hypothetical protein